jgi:LptD protein
MKNSSLRDNKKRVLSPKNKFVILSLFLSITMIFISACITSQPGRVREKSSIEQTDSIPNETTLPATTASDTVMDSVSKVLTQVQKVRVRPSIGAAVIDSAGRVIHGEKANLDSVARFSAVISDNIPDSLAPVSRQDSMIFDSGSLFSGVIDIPFLPDSLRSDSLFTDSLVAETESKSDLDTTIFYGGEDVSFHIPTKTSIMRGNASVSYKDMKINAYEIKIDWTTNLMNATPKLDTLWTDTLKTEIDTIMLSSLPTFVQGGQTMTGTLMRMHMKSKEGYIEGGRTSYGDGFYDGEAIQKITDEVLFIQDGSYSSCDNENPHYCFTAKKMKMIHKDKVVGKPVVLRFSGVPVAMLPFGMFSIKGGRRSGIIIPTYGDNSRQGRFFRNLGYYWAASQYWDTKFLLDFYEKTGFVFRDNTVYKIQDKIRGGISGSYNYQRSEAGVRKDWDLRIIHDHRINESTSFKVNGTFVSNGGYRDLSTNTSQRFDQKIQSNATLQKQWKSIGASMTVNLNHQYNLKTDENSQTLPNVSFSLGSKNLFPTKDKSRKQDKNLIYSPPVPRRKPGERIEREDDDDRWYHNITYRYSSSLKNSRTENRQEIGVIETPLIEENRSGIQHRISINAPQKVFKYLTLNPSINYKEDWFNERREYSYDESGDEINKEERGFFQRRTIDGRFNISTKFWGYFNINRGSVKVIRHQVSPSIGLSFVPDYSDEEWGYYQRISRWVWDHDNQGDSTWVHNNTKLDRYNKSIWGNTGQGKKLNINGSIKNLFQMKRVILNEDGEEEEIKTDLFSYSISSSYNLAADSMNFSDIRGSFNAKPISAKNSIGPLESLSIDFSTTHSPYQYKQDDPNGDFNGGRVNEFYYKEGSGLNVVRLTNFSTNSRFVISGINPFTRTKKQAEKEDSEKSDSLLSSDKQIDSIRNDLDERFSDPYSRGGDLGKDTPWKVSGGVRYNLSMTNPMQPRKTITGNSSFTLKLSRNWEISYRTSMDLHTREITSSNLGVRRDLHCWEARFDWSPTGYAQGFMLYIGLKAPMLRDVKLEQRRGSSPLRNY